MPHLTLYDQLGDMPILGAIVERGVARSRLGADRGPESSPKVSPMLEMDPPQKNGLGLGPPPPPLNGGLGKV